MATGILSPWPRYTVLNAAGKPISGALINTYIAGTTTPIATYSDVALTVANANPIVANSSGQIGPVFLSPGSSYKFVFTNPDASSLFSQDNIAAGGGATNTDIIGTAGEALTGGKAVYLSDGSGGKTAGLWYLADSANAYSSTTSDVGIVPASIALGVAGTIRLGGQLTGLTSLTVGASYYISTAGGITATAPVNRRFIGQADTTSSLVMEVIPPVLVTDPGIVDGRLSLQSGTAVTTADYLAATLIYYTPYIGSQIALFDGVNWQSVIFTELSIAVPATTAQMYDLFVYSNSGIATLELLAWTNDTTRATALTTQNGVLVKAGALTRRYVGSFRTTAVSGQTEDSAAKRYLWNYYNRVTRALIRKETTNTWNYTVATIRQANASTANQVEVVIGIAEVFVDVSMTHAFQPNTNTNAAAGIGYDTTSAFTGGSGATQAMGTNLSGQLNCRLLHAPAIGRHFYSWNEYSEATAGTTAWFGTNPSGGPTGISLGLSGSIQG